MRNPDLYRNPHHLEYHETLKVTVYCSFEFGDFPFDSHVCPFNFGASDNADYNLNLLPSTILFHENSTVLGDTEGKFKNHFSSIVSITSQKFRKFLLKIPV